MSQARLAQIVLEAQCLCARTGDIATRRRGGDAASSAAAWRRTCRAARNQTRHSRLFRRHLRLGGGRRTARTRSGSERSLQTCGLAALCHRLRWRGLRGGRCTRADGVDADGLFRACLPFIAADRAARLRSLRPSRCAASNSESGDEAHSRCGAPHLYHPRAALPRSQRARAADAGSRPPRRQPSWTSS